MAEHQIDVLPHAEQQSEVIIETRNVSRIYPGVTALDRSTIASIATRSTC